MSKQITQINVPDPYKISDLISGQIAKDCIKLMEMYLILELLQKDTLDKEDLVLINAVTSFKIDTYDSELEPLLSKMHYLCRENSRGGSLMNKFYVSEKLYNNVFPDIKWEITSFGCKIVKSDILQENLVIGIAKSKFKWIEPQNLIIIGKIDG